MSRSIVAIPSSKIRLGMIFSFVLTILAVLWNIVYPGAGYDQSVQFYAIIALFPVVFVAYLFLATKELPFGIMLMIIYQTWNLFLSPYLGDQQVKATMRYVNPAYIDDMGLYSCISVFMLFYGFMMAYQHIKVKPFWSEKKLSNVRVQRSIIMCIALGYALIIMSSLSSAMNIQVTFFGAVENFMPTVIASLLVIYVNRGGRNIFAIIAGVIYVAFFFIVFIGGTLFTKSLMLLLGPLVTYIYLNKKIPYISVIIVTIILMPVFISRHEYRNIGLYASRDEAFALGLKIIEEQYSNRDSQDIFDDIVVDEQKDEYEDNRFEGVTYLGHIVHCHQDMGYPYVYGETFAWLPTLIIPHALMPFRPGQNMGDSWAEYYKLKDPSWKCSINFPMLVEFYCNFGWLGMVLMSLLNGIFISWVMSKFDYGKGDLNLILFLFISLKLIVIEGNLSLIYGFVLQILFVCWVIKYFKLGRLFVRH